MMDSTNNYKCETTGIKQTNHHKTPKKNMPTHILATERHGFMFNLQYVQMLKNEKEAKQDEKAMVDSKLNAREPKSPIVKSNVEQVRKLKTPNSKKTPCMRSTPYSTTKKIQRNENGRSLKPNTNRSLQA